MYLCMYVCLNVCMYFLLCINLLGSRVNVMKKLGGINHSCTKRININTDLFSFLFRVKRVGSS